MRRLGLPTASTPRRFFYASATSSCTLLCNHAHAAAALRHQSVAPPSGPAATVVVAPPPTMNSPPPNGGSSNDEKLAEVKKYPTINLATASRCRSVIAEELKALNERRKSNPAHQPCEWIASEKVHGSNFAIHLESADGGEHFRIRYAKRNEYIKRGEDGGEWEDFFGYQALEPIFTEQIFCIRKLLIDKLNEDRRRKTKSGGAAKTANSEKAETEEEQEANNNAGSDDDIITDLPVVILQGELFGGKYIHPELALGNTQRYFLKPPSDPFANVNIHGRAVKSVQADPFPQYCKDLNLYVVDLLYLEGKKKTKNNNSAGGIGRNEEEEDDPKLMRLSYDEARAIWEKVTPPLIFQQPLVRGPLEKVLAIDVERLETKIPLLVGNGNHYIKNNFAEGIVLRRMVPTGPVELTEKLSDALKLKAYAFQETRHKDEFTRDPEFEKLQQNCLRKFGPQIPEKEAVFPSVTSNNDNNKDKAKNSNKAIKDCENLIAHVSERRLKGLLSKIGHDALQTDSPKERSRIQDKLAFLLAQDALKDYLKDTADEAVLSAPLLQRREFARYALFEAKKMVMEKWSEISNPEGEGV